MNENKSYLPKFRIVGFENYYENDKGEIINILTNRFISVNRDRSWQYYILVDLNGKRCKVGLDNIVKKPYLDFGGKIDKDLLEKCKEIGFI